MPASQNASFDVLSASSLQEIHDYLKATHSAKRLADHKHKPGQQQQQQQRVHRRKSHKQRSAAAKALKSRRCSRRRYSLDMLDGLKTHDTITWSKACEGSGVGDGDGDDDYDNAVDDATVLNNDNGDDWIVCGGDENGRAGAPGLPDEGSGVLVELFNLAAEYLDDEDKASLADEEAGYAVI